MNPALTLATARRILLGVFSFLIMFLIKVRLFVSAFARTEFRAVQFMPLFVLPQILLCGLFVPRGEMGWLLNRLSDVMPLSYAAEALTRVTTSGTVDATLIRNLIVIGACALAALVLGAATLRRRTA